MARRTHARFRRTSVLTLTAALLVLVPAGSAFACGGLVTSNGTVSLTRTTTLAAYHDGVEHYVTAFEFAGADATEVGSIVPLPGVPTKVIKGGDWTLQRLIIETSPPAPVALAAEDSAAGGAKVILETQIDALDITVLKGGAVDVGTWARDHGFFLPPDAPEVLAFYAERSPIFMAVKFDVGRANDQGVQQGQGTPVHVVIPTPNPWVPLRILALGRDQADLVQADVFLLTDREPATLPLAELPNGDPDQRGLIQEVSEPASASLLSDLRSDRGMKWMPTDDMWLTKIDVNTPAGDLVNDLAVDASGFGQPSAVAAGLDASQLPGRGRRPVDRPVGDARRGRAHRRRRPPSAGVGPDGTSRPDASRTDASGGVRGAPRLPAARRRGCGHRRRLARQRHAPAADAHRAHHDPLLPLRPERHRDPARPDDPLRGREHRPDRSRVHRGRRGRCSRRMRPAPRPITRRDPARSRSRPARPWSRR